MVFEMVVLMLIWGFSGLGLGLGRLWVCLIYGFPVQVLVFGLIWFMLVWEWFAIQVVCFGVLLWRLVS